MILADKIITLRKKCGWSQEELADRLGVSRQSVSKWEGAQSVPDLDRILKLSEIFGVSVDALLKDELSLPEAPVSVESDPQPPLRQLAMEEACAFLQQRSQAARQIALGVSLCILSPVSLILLGGLSSQQLVSENAAAGLGMIVLFLFVAAAVALFIPCGQKAQPWAWLETDAFETAYGVDSMVRERRQRFSDAYTRANVMATCLCVLSLVPMFAVLCFTRSELALVLSLCAMLALLAAAVYLYISVGVVWASLQKILQEGDYTAARRKRRSKTGAISTAYWLAATAVYLLYSLGTNDWKNSWIVWPVAGILYAALCVCMDAFVRSDR